MSSRNATRIDGCVTGRYVEDTNGGITGNCEFTADALVFDNQWIEFHNPTLSRTYTTFRNETPYVEQIQGWLRVPVRRVRRLTYDLCVTV